MGEISQQLQKEYSIRFANIAEYRNSVWKILIDQYFQKLMGVDKHILDLGSGWGEFINNVHAEKKYAMDLNPDGKSQVEKDVSFLQQDCSLPWNLKDESLDIVFTSNFFEHLPAKSSLLNTLKQAFRCLKPGGRLICLGPNIKYVGLAYWDFYDHYLPLSHHSMVEALNLADFNVVSVIPRFLPYTMANDKQPPLILVKLYLKMPFFWNIFGKQFLITARKPNKSAPTIPFRGTSVI